MSGPRAFMSASRVAHNASSRRTLVDTGSGRSYEAAVAALNTLQSNAKVVAAIRKHGRDANQQAIPEMLHWFAKLGYAPADFDKLNIIHVAGTKGKGSTSAFISSILARSHQKPNGPRVRPIGLFTSPHLRFVRERIQINNEMMSENMFAKYFFEVWDQLSAAGDGSKPMYFRFLTLMAFHAFLQQGIKSAIIECGIGGEYDSTNIVHAPTVTAISALGIDHEALLGNTLPEIAWHKAGIFKHGAIALTVEQPKTALDVLYERAAKAGGELQIVDVHPQIESGEVKLGLTADYQKSNASLAVVACSAHLRKLGHLSIPDLIANKNADLPETFRVGLEKLQWPGRSQIKHAPQQNAVWYIDGAHTKESIALCGKWFADNVQDQDNATELILIFNQQSRDAVELAKALHSTLLKGAGRSFASVIFTTNITYADASYKSDLVSLNNDDQEVSALIVQNRIAQAWHQLDPTASVSVTSSIEQAIAIAHGKSSTEVCQSARILVTGSLHLVGGVLEILENLPNAPQSS